jgi:hypothetical protein
MGCNKFTQFNGLVVRTDLGNKKPPPTIETIAFVIGQCRSAPRKWQFKRPEDRWVVANPIEEVGNESTQCGIISSS